MASTAKISDRIICAIPNCKATRVPLQALFLCRVPANNAKALCRRNISQIGRHDEPKALNLSMGNHGKCDGLPTCRVEPPIECTPGLFPWLHIFASPRPLAWPGNHMRTNTSYHFFGRGGECAQCSETVSRSFYTCRRFTKIGTRHDCHYHILQRPFLPYVALLGFRRCSQSGIRRASPGPSPTFPAHSGSRPVPDRSKPRRVLFDAETLLKLL
jgi:hypothetical protein